MEKKEEGGVDMEKGERVGHTLYLAQILERYGYKVMAIGNAACMELTQDKVNDARPGYPFGPMDLINIQVLRPKHAG